MVKFKEPPLHIPEAFISKTTFSFLKMGFQVRIFMDFNSFPKHPACFTVDRFGEHELTLSEKE